MMNAIVNRYLAILLCVALAAAGCATTGKSTAGGAALGALAGGIIGHQSGHTWEGALIGGAVGGLVGYAIGVTREKQLMTRQQYENQMKAKNETVPQQPMIKMEDLKSTPETVKPGQAVAVSGTYLALGPTDAAPTGTMKLMKDNKVVAESPLNVNNTGYNEFTKSITLPKDAASGNYIVEVDMKHGASTESKQTIFTVA